MNDWRRALSWCSARGRAHFLLTVLTVALLTGACCALVLLPRGAGADTARPVAGEVVGSRSTDPRVAEVERIMAPFGAVEVRTAAGGGLVLAHPGQAEAAATLAAELPAATAAVTDLWGPDWSREAVVVAAANPSEFAALLRAPDLLPAEVAAASVADPFRPGTRPTGQRVVFAPDAGTRLSPAELRTLLRHELTHVAARAQTVDGAPQWMLEGFAEYAAHRGLGSSFAAIAPTVLAAAQRGGLPADLPADAAFTGAGAVLAYEQAWTVSAFVADRYGEDRLVRLYRAVAAGRLDTAGEDRVLREVLGTDRTAFVARWREWVADRAR
ncbi:peptidase MA family metallohydrolase [Nocardia farcinica]|uniref:peptidase MA family metallohydrolase n=1 Tax=Nocardia farcinica TaxID=37329 RepID=UPI001894384D|nr:hypothetical protein [Nocardia farcinica]MBF6071579.1 hypothetical protein [Nocardia farcinica]